VSASTLSDVLAELGRALREGPPANRLRFAAEMLEYGHVGAAHDIVAAVLRDLAAMLPPATAAERGKKE